MASFNTTGGLNDHEGFSIQGDFIGSFDRLVAEMPEICNKALNTGAYIIKENVRSVFAQKMPAATRPFKVPATSKGGYKITKPDLLIDAVRQSKAKVTRTTISVSGRESGSPLFIARMYDSGSKDRYNTTYRGVKLKARKYAGRLTGVHYFDPGISQGEAEAYNAMQRIFEKYIENTI